MRYSMLGRTGLRVSVLGFGCMRLPMQGLRVDRDKSTPLLRRAVELGVNLFDTAIMYCNNDSQAAVGEALKPLRDKVFLSTKNNLHEAPVGEWRRALEDSLRLLQTDHLDFYHFHGIGWKLFT
jgi:aryl-alcohol dehydrogenase-like predicted oxidoreductase